VFSTLKPRTLSQTWRDNPVQYHEAMSWPTLPWLN